MKKKQPLEYRLRSLKHILLVHQIRAKIADNTFDEQDIRLGLMLIRETVYDAIDKSKGNGDTPVRLRRGMPLLVDICDAVAHPSVKDRGAIFDFVATNDERIKLAKEKMFKPRYVDMGATPDGDRLYESVMPPAIKELATKDAALAFQFFLDGFVGIEFDHVHFHGIWDDISLCLYSILQYCQIPLWSKEEENLPIKDRRFAYLGINSFQGHYHLYAAVANSLQFSETERLEMRAQEAPSYANFAVCPWIAPIGDGMEIDIRESVVVSAVRCPDGKLRLKEI